MIRQLFLSLLFVSMSFCAFAQNDTIYISTLNTTHLMFGSELTYVDISNKVVAAKIIDSNKSVLAIKAREPFSFHTSVSALETDGTMHTYIVAYEESPSRLILDYRDMPPAVNESKAIVRSSTNGKKAHNSRRLYHVADKEYGITFFCDDIFVENDISTFSLCLENKSGIRYDCSEAIKFQDLWTKR